MGILGALVTSAVVVFIAKWCADSLDAVDKGDEECDLDDDEVDEGPASRFCARCGDDVDPETGACERCLTRMVRRQEGDEARRAAMPEPDEAEEREVERLQTFLDAPHPESAFFCPSCLAELNPERGACRGCSKPALPAVDVIAHVERCVQDITSDWFLPVLDDREGPFFDAVLEELRIDPSEPPLDYRVRNAYASWSGLHVAELHSRNVPVLFLQRRALPRFRELMCEAEMAKMHEENRGKLLDRLDRLLRGRTLR